MYQSRTVIWGCPVSVVMVTGHPQLCDRCPKDREGEGYDPGAGTLGGFQEWLPPLSLRTS